ncbi:hypothetical protein [Saccharibacillus sacchari]|uniref:Uncharacterized protein n=1 Tax=Saccharibacillus sacchari TaxID=456493 RepID=A0ACC6PCY9_9BACL
MKRKGTLRRLGAVLGSAALLAVLGACSGGAPVETADGGSYSAERPRPASDGGTGAAESSRPETDPAQPTGSGVADESSRPPDPSAGGEAQPPSEQGRPDESASEPGTGKGVADEQSRPEGEAGESAGEAAREGASDPAERSAAGSAADERSRPSDEGGSGSEATDSSDRSSATEQNRPVDSNQTETPSADKQKSADQEQQRPEYNTTTPQTDEKNRSNDSSSKDEDSQTAKDQSSSDRTSNVSDEEKRPVQAPKWNGPDYPSEQSRTDGSLPGSGHYLITEHLHPGLYRSVGNIEYWERTSGKSGTEQDRIVRVKPTGPAVVEIKPSDIGFISKGSGIWKPVSGKTGSFKTEFGAGTYIVGVDIAPGRYRSLIGATRWETLSGFSGEQSDRIRGASPGKSAPVTVEIKATDKGFSSSGALWTKVE